MEPFDPQIISIVAQVFGGPGVILLGLAYAWSHGPGAKIEHISRRVDEGMHKMEKAVEGIRTDLQTHRDAVLTEQQAHRERLQRLEIETELMGRRSHDRA
jgi:hypothetical protein